jgi:branched-chain amino acid transport system permease protein
MKQDRMLARAVSERWTMVAIVVLLALGAVIASVAGVSVFMDVYTFFCISVTMVLGLQMFMGNSGILNWTYVGFVGIGAFISSIMSTAPLVKKMGVPNMYPALIKIHMPVVPALLVGALVAAGVAAVIAYPLMRLSDAAGVITLFATLIVIHVVMTQWDNVTNGPRTFFGVTAFTTLWIALGFACLSVAVAHIFRESSLGLRLRASRDDRHAAKAIGINVVGARYLSFVLSSFVAGFAGGLWAHYITSFSPKSFYITEAFVLLTMLVIGGSGSISGAVAGTALVSLMRQLLIQLEGFLNNSGIISFQVYGLTEVSVAILLIVILIWRPAGIIGGQEIRLPALGKKR